MSRQILTDEELEVFIDRWAQVSAVEPFDRDNAWVSLTSQMEVIQAADLAEHRAQLKQAHEHLVWAVFYADEKEVRQSRLLVFWARFQFTIAERKTEVQSPSAESEAKTEPEAPTQLSMF